MNKKLKSILKKTSKREHKITESMLRYILYGEKDSKAISKVTFGSSQLNIVEGNVEEEEDEEEELRRSLEAEEHEDISSLFIEQTPDEGKGDSEVAPENEVVEDKVGNKMDEVEDKVDPLKMRPLRRAA